MRVNARSSRAKVRPSGAAAEAVVGTAAEEQGGTLVMKETLLLEELTAAESPAVMRVNKERLSNLAHQAKMSISRLSRSTASSTIHFLDLPQVKPIPSLLP